MKPGPVHSLAHSIHLSTQQFLPDIIKPESMEKTKYCMRIIRKEKSYVNNQNQSTPVLAILNAKKRKRKVRAARKAHGSAFQSGFVPSSIGHRSRGRKERKVDRRRHNPLANKSVTYLGKSVSTLHSRIPIRVHGHREIVLSRSIRASLIDPKGGFQIPKRD